MKHYKWMAPAVTVAVVGLVLTTFGGQSSAAPKHKVYMLGDSYALRMQNYGFASSYPKGWSVQVSGLSSRSIKNGPSLNGSAQLQTDKTVASNADAIVIELGTNTQDGSTADFTANLKQLLKDAHAMAPNAFISWVTIGTKAPALQNIQIERNQAAKAMINKLKFQVSVIPWYDSMKNHGDWFTETGRLHPNQAGTAYLNYLVRVTTERQLTPFATPQ